MRLFLCRLVSWIAAGCVIGCGPLPVAPDSPDWVLVTYNSQSRLYFRKGSGRGETIAKERQVYLVEARWWSAGSGDTRDELWFVPVDDCIAGAGYVYFLDPSGNVRSSLPFGRDNKFMAAVGAEFLCESYFDWKSDRRPRPAPPSMSATPHNVLAS